MDSDSPGSRCSGGQYSAGSLWGGRAAGGLKERRGRLRRELWSCSLNGELEFARGAGVSAQMPPGRADKNAFM